MAPDHRDAAADQVLERRPVRAAGRDDARPAVPDGARVPRAGQGPGAVRDASTRPRSRPPTRRSSPRCARRRRRSTGSRARWRPGCRTLAAHRRGAVRRRRGRGSGPRRPTGKELLERVHGAARLRQAEGPDLRRPAGQAARRTPRGLGGRPSAPTPRTGYRSVADVVDAASLQKVRDFKKAEEGRGEGRAG